MATDERGRRVGVVLVGLAVLAAAALLVEDGRILLVSTVVAALLVGLGAVVSAWRSFALFICGVIVVRPLLDLTAAPRSNGIAPTDVFGGAVLLVSLLWLWMNRSALADRLRSDLARSILAMLGMMALSAFAAPVITSSAQVVIRVATGAAIFFVVDLLLHLRRVTARQLLTALGLAYVVPLAYPLLGLVGVPVTHEKDGVTALKSVFYLSNNYGHFLVPLVTVASAVFVGARGRARLAALGVLGVASVELLGTQTRGAWIAAVVAVMCVGLLLNRRLVLGAAVVGVLVALYVPAVHARLTSLEPNASRPRTQSSWAWRIDHWEQLLPLTEQAPIIGLGPNESVLLTSKEPHNDYVRALVETGVLGLATYLWFLAALVATAVRAVRRVGGTPLRSGRHAAGGPRGAPPEVDRMTRATVVGLASYTVGVLLASMAENLIDNLTFLSVLMPCAALLLHAWERPDGWAPERPRAAAAGAPVPRRDPRPDPQPGTGRPAAVP